MASWMENASACMATYTHMNVCIAGRATQKYNASSPIHSMGGVISKSPLTLYCRLYNQLYNQLEKTFLTVK